MPANNTVNNQTKVESPRVANEHHENGSSDGASKEVHVDPKRYKTKMCRNFLKDGVCPYETRCMFAHGPHELRTPDENTRDGLVTESAIKKHQQQLMYEARVAEAQAAAPCTCPDCVPMAYPPYGAPYSSRVPYAMHPMQMYGGYCDCPDCVSSASMAPAPYYPPTPAYDAFAP